MSKIGIVGHGFVGKAVEYGFKDKHEIFIYDKYKNLLPLESVVKNAEYIFVSVPTPMDENYTQIDLSIIYEAVGDVIRVAREFKVEPLVIIKSTVIPGTTEDLSKKHNYKRIIFNPEFLTEANFLDDFVNSDRIVIGGNDNQDREKVKRLYQESLPPTPIFETNPTTAEMVKYMSNTYLATKVIFGNEMSELCEKLGISYPEVKEMVVADKRIYDSHLDVSEYKGFGGKCFPKDTVAILGLAKKLGVDLSILEAAWKKNLKIRKVRDWEEIEGAVAKSNKSKE